MRADTARKVQASERDPEFGPWLAQATILVVDDEPGMRNFLVRTLAPRCKAIEEAADAEEASRKLDQHHFDVVILDNIMPGKNGVDWLIEQRAIGFFADVILMTAYADLETAIRALRAGAVDFVLKPFRSNQILNAVARCLDRIRLQRENFVLRYELRATADHILLRDKLIGGSAAIQQVRETLARVAPLPTTVLLTGESGTGKEVAARSLHALSDRAAKPFVPVNCAAIPPDVIESELFGHVRGAFTGAESGREGLFLHAQGGTLFLDEIGEMPLATQSKLLRVIEDRRVRPVGAEREVPIDLRFVFATNANLEKLVQEGGFRPDLYYRINVMQLKLPPLRDRGDDVLELASLFMHKLSQQLGMPMVPIDKAAKAVLSAYAWPGNVRELRNLIERSLILGGFPEDFRGWRGGSVSLPSGTLEEVERRHILAVLEETGGDRDEAARRLGISRKTIDRKFVFWNA
ncbi:MULTISPECIES: sigma-54-dependent transcriptional regulator [Alphaproteobacteria]|uniref:Sigma-54-dependent Fis family transcriptional regulator n=2 Tax=Alphaproteobacteria TaxID=28211 RepID=A0A512HJZ5_9HYPH|nr:MULTISPECIES: sigma-54 dependent transcriptional regulator [Alphaproteobacteria]GEO85772.1 sigma-54-dependent Fis family transcriptional regulator [Ciceribacter naphthalenivorans]GLR21868.1 sigma-54-dependent Fis family transcriptional regulator [Ciceribacter naphthalenivorans]GLT04724.1 sigma-54-dependent Fis family transcriptional regulator [Sphingomonas psychrolutea]